MRVLVGVAIVLVVAACGPKRKNQCVGNTASGCVNGEVCSFDRAKGCHICVCRPWDQTPAGNDPDDRGAPPAPVH